uniref:Uncharacterized protein n=1 Tax=Corethron hystrix TaxID=216773 RepID=A0A7S1BGI7_9STRA|mmetsp:Transcript_26761/g.61598  ORF Transcript_26761/g.61598 Transcript_26761/m.61598 type:complete len:277 (+) Transcript_26761:469-1299(+)|eukprot:CAMPEP_0113299222 /NCGR_PEP_ID=MMETSP0010_2-20120614/1345_1 /TAXON_ID=216773 ORGANISM="Corethron hystrix, Strain 308" /NCGR_SAMPLE_ID=MMETSP0010_2 /ASSEMBLY_ACC=CAM_ASM_000155 /LENGTH=276 /DNA_ID=CAMNT_0000152417 /DNA_START=393 /DNA_END=1223 /DNA_ORIENTATION=- /assembly_acc=CAM_ASM_000155
MADDDAYSTDDGLGICRVYSNEDWFTAFVQGLLAFVALMSLWFKRQNEVPRRSFQTWFLDVSKQGVGAVYGHVANMFISAVIVYNIRGDNVLDDECAWYAILYLIDTVFGLVLALMFLYILDVWAEKYNWDSLKNSGLYEGPDAVKHWWHQVIAWIVVLTLVKVFIVLFMWAFSPFLATWGGVLFGPLESNIRFELLFVMIFFPGLLNVIYFWVTDHFLKHNPAMETDYNAMGDTATETELVGSKNYTAPSVPEAVDQTLPNKKNVSSDTNLSPIV